MTTRQEKAARAAATHLHKQEQWRLIAEFIYPKIVAALDPELHMKDGIEDYLLPSKHDIKMTARELNAKFSRAGKDIIELLFIRWQTKAAHTRHGKREPRWRLNTANIFIFNDWLVDNPNPTPRQVLDFLKSAGFERLRRLRTFQNKKVGDIILSAEEHKKLLNTSLREQRRAWQKTHFGMVSRDTEKDSGVHH